MANIKISDMAPDNTTPRIPTIEQEQPTIDNNFLFNNSFTITTK